VIDAAPTQRRRESALVVHVRVVVCVVLVLGGCSFARVRVPDRLEPGVQVVCPALSPGLDTIGAVFMMVGTAAELVEPSGSSNTPLSGRILTIPLAAVGLIYAASAVYG
jgi:hypothetical protein